MHEIVEIAEAEELTDLVGRVTDDNCPADLVGFAAGLVKDPEERGVGEPDTGELQHDRLSRGEVWLDGVLEVVEARQVNLAPQGNDGHEFDVYFELVRHEAAD